MQHFAETVAQFRRANILRHATPLAFELGVDLDDYTVPGREAVITFLREALAQIRWLGLHGHRDYDGEAHRALAQAQFQEELALERIRRQEAARA